MSRTCGSRVCPSRIRGVRLPVDKDSARSGRNRGCRGRGGHGNVGILLTRASGPRSMLCSVCILNSASSHLITRRDTEISLMSFLLTVRTNGMREAGAKRDYSKG